MMLYYVEIEQVVQKRELAKSVSAAFVEISSTLPLHKHESVLTKSTLF